MSAVDLTVIGDKRLIRALEKLPGAMQRKVARPALRASAVRMNKAAVQKLAAMWPPVSGDMLAAFKAQKVKSIKGKGGIRFAAMLPTREELGIPADAEHYFPNVLEYGTNLIAGRSFIRATVDEMAEQEFRMIGQDIGVRIEAAWASLVAA